MMCTTKDGEQLKQKYLDSLGEGKVQEIKGKINELLDKAVNEISDNIASGKPPFATISSGTSKSGIISKNNDLEKLFQSVEFNIISKMVAEKRGLVCNVEQRMEMPSAINMSELLGGGSVGAQPKPIVEFVLIVTFV